MNPIRDQIREVLSVVRWPAGGIRTYLLYNYPHLLEAGYRFTVVGPDDAACFADEVDAWPGCQYCGVPVSAGQCHLRPTVRRLLQTGRFHLLHSQGHRAGCEAVWANFELEVPHIVTLHDVVRDDQLPGVAGYVKRCLLGLALGRADAVIAPSNDARDNNLAYLPGLARGRCEILTILHGIDTSRFAEEVAPKRPLREQLGIGPHVFLLGFFGRFMTQKGFLLLVEALDRLLAAGAPRPFHLVAVGSGDLVREYSKAVRRRSGLAPHVSFLEGVPNIAPLMRQVDLVVMPSLWEAFGLLALEAMAAGVPLLGSDCVGLREILAGTPARTAATGSCEAWTTALAEALRNPWTEEARQYAPLACERYDIRHSVAQLREVFDQYALQPPARKQREVVEV